MRTLRGFRTEGDYMKLSHRQIYEAALNKLKYLRLQQSFYENDIEAIEITNKETFTKVTEIVQELKDMYIDICNQLQNIAELEMQMIDLQAKSPKEILEIPFNESQDDEDVIEDILQKPILTLTEEDSGFEFPKDDISELAEKSQEEDVEKILLENNEKIVGSISDIVVPKSKPEQEEKEKEVLDTKNIDDEKTINDELNDESKKQHDEEIFDISQTIINMLTLGNKTEIFAQLSALKLEFYNLSEYESKLKTMLLDRIKEIQ